MMVKRVAGALGAELQAVNLGDGPDAELAGTLRALLNEHEVRFYVIRPSNPRRRKHWLRSLDRYKPTPPTTPWKACLR